MKEQTVNYFENFNGFYVEPQENNTAAESAVGVVMIHEVWGLNDTIKNYARKLGGEGFQVFAVDLFGHVWDAGSETDRQAAFAAMSAIDQSKADANMRAAVEFLRAKGAEKIASIGFCFGGAESLLLAVSGEQMNGTIIYYGRTFTDADKLAKIKWPVLGFFGGQDTHITPALVKDFENALNAAGIKNEIIIYPNANHAFARPSGEQYAPAEAADAWAKTVTFLKQM